MKWDIVKILFHFDSKRTTLTSDVLFPVLIADNTHMFFILSCAAVLVATFTFIIVFACRPRHHNRSQVGYRTERVATPYSDYLHNLQNFLLQMKNILYVSV